MDKVRIGIIGYGKMGSQHVKSFVDGKIPNAVLTCVADIDEKRIEAAKALGEISKKFRDCSPLLQNQYCRIPLQKWSAWLNTIIQPHMNSSVRSSETV